MENGTRLQNLVAKVAENRIKSGKLQDGMAENLSVLLAYQQITVEQFQYLMGLLEPVAEQPTEPVETTETNTEASAS